MAPNVYEDARRTQKATALADALQAAQVTPEEAASMGLGGWKLAHRRACEATGEAFGPPSTRTMAVALTLLLDRRTRQLAASSAATVRPPLTPARPGQGGTTTATVVPADPFHGLPGCD